MPGFLYNRNFMDVLKEMMNLVPKTETGLYLALEQEMNVVISKAMIGTTPEQQDWVDVFHILEKYLPEDNLEPWQKDIVNTFGGHDYFND